MKKSTLVLVFPGFEKTSPQSQMDRIRHCANKTGEIWKFQHERKSLDDAAGNNCIASHSETQGANWKTSTDIVLFSWQDIIEDYEGVPHPAGFLANMPKFMAFFLDGTVSRYWKASKRYFAFTIFPVLLLAIFAIFSALLFWFLAGFLVSGIALAIGTLIFAAVSTLILCKWPGERLYLLLTINDWGFARDMVHRSNPAIEARYHDFATQLASRIKASDHDEIIISGHSFGAVWAVAALALALEENPGLLATKRVVFLALGSSLLKIALAPGAGFLRDWTKRVVAEKSLFWHEIQTKHDFIAFYKSNPFEELGIGELGAELRLDRPDYKKAISAKRFAKIRKSFYETHRQYILYQDVRVPYDYMLRLFGPLNSRELALNPALTDAIDAHGKLV